MTILENISITSFAGEGKAIARINGKVCFVKNAVPGDTADLLLTFQKKKYDEAVVYRLIIPSPLRTKALCEHFGICGGCNWQNMEYSAQLSFKQHFIKDTFEKLGKLKFQNVEPVIPSDETFYYRNKMEFTFTNWRWLEEKELKTANDTKEPGLGLHIQGHYNKVLDLKHCYLQQSPSDTIRNSLKDFALKNKIDFFDINLQKGYLRNLIIRTGTENELMVIVQFFQEEKSIIHLIMNFLQHEFPEITSLLYVINPGGNDNFSIREVKTWMGKDHILQKLEHLIFKTGPKTFFQTNTKQAVKMLKLVGEMADLKGHENVYDLYCGMGTFGLYLANKAKKVTGIEFVQESIASARENADLNGIKNVSFYSGEIREILKDDFIYSEGKPDLIITDPPRNGMHADVIKKIIELSPKKIIYISCNPATQARDLFILCQYYTIMKIQPVDMFPHTYHVENVVELVRV